MMLMFCCSQGAPDESRDQQVEEGGVAGESHDLVEDSATD